MFVKENPDRKKRKKFRTLQTKSIKDESNFHDYFGYTFRCATGWKVRGETPVFSRWIHLTMLVMMAILPT